MAAGVKAKGRQASKAERGVLADIIVACRVSHLDRVVLNRIEDPHAGDNFAGGENLDLELAVGQVAHQLGEQPPGAIERIETFGIARDRCHLRAGDDCAVRGRGDGRAGCGKREADRGPAGQQCVEWLGHS